MDFLQKLRTHYKSWLSSLSQISTLEAYSKRLVEFEIEAYLQTHLYQHPRYKDPQRLNQYERKIYSQCGEDGILAEIFQRIGIEHHYFVEFGVGDGLENNTAYLLIQHWQGLWIEANPAFVDRIQVNFNSAIAQHHLHLKSACVYPENIEAFLDEMQVPPTFDLLSIDIDGNDYWVWQAITKYRPRVVVIEYNATYPPSISWVMTYAPSYSSNQTTYFGASLASLETLAMQKGYRLVGCSFSGVNAFFVREDLVGDRFCEPHTALNHYEPPRYFLLNRNVGHPRAFGEFESI